MLIWLYFFYDSSHVKRIEVAHDPTVSDNNFL